MVLFQPKFGSCLALVKFGALGRDLSLVIGRDDRFSLSTSLPLLSIFSSNLAKLLLRTLMFRLFRLSRPSFDPELLRPLPPGESRRLSTFSLPWSTKDPFFVGLLVESSEPDEGRNILALCESVGFIETYVRKQDKIEYLKHGLY